MNYNSTIFDNTLNMASVIDGNTLTGNTIKRNILTNNSTIETNYFKGTSGGGIIGCNLSLSYLWNHTFTNNSVISDCIFNSSQLDGCILNGYPKIITYLTMNYTVNQTNLNSATIIFGNYPKTIYVRPDGQKRITYYNNSDALVITTITT